MGKLTGCISASFEECNLRPFSKHGPPEINVVEPREIRRIGLDVSDLEVVGCLVGKRKMGQGSAHSSRDLIVRKCNAQWDIFEFLAEIISHGALWLGCYAVPDCQAVLSVMSILKSVDRAEHTKSHYRAPESLVWDVLFSALNKRKRSHCLSDSSSGNTTRHALTEIGPDPTRRPSKRAYGLFIVWWAEAMLDAEVSIAPSSL
jgi:hypothetical protein